MSEGEIVETSSWLAKVYKFRSSLVQKCQDATERSFRTFVYGCRQMIEAGKGEIQIVKCKSEYAWMDH